MKSFEALWEELGAKIAANDPNSGTNALIEAGVHAIGKKIIEEAGEVWIAAEYQSNDELALEISQLISGYSYMGENENGVMMVYCEEDVDMGIVCTRMELDEIKFEIDDEYEDEDGFQQLIWYSNW